MRDALVPVDIADDEEANEGKVLLKLHKYRERNTKLVKRKKASVLDRTGKLECEVCSFNFFERYGDLGDGFIECHHKKSVHLLEPNERTKMADLALVCANCHRMLHRSRDGLAVNKLRQILAR